MFDYKPATLHLENVVDFKGFSFVHDQSANGEVVFSTAMVGYPENLTDPSCSGQVGFEHRLVNTWQLLYRYTLPRDRDVIDLVFLNSCPTHL